MLLDLQLVQVLQLRQVVLVLLVGLAVQIDSIARLFVNSAEAAAAASEEAYGIEDEDDADS